jgi:hypothetical protein
MVWSKNIWIIVITGLLLSILFVSPVTAKITTSVETMYDFDGASKEFGEEIAVRITIAPGDSEVRDLQIKITDRDALIDGASFKHTIIPTGAQVNVERDGYTVLCNRLAPGESIILSFNAYPKTIKQNELIVVESLYSYTQLGESIADLEIITVDTSGSVWFQYQRADHEKTTVSWTFYLGILLIIISIGLVIYQLNQKRKMMLKIDEKSNHVRELLFDISNKLDTIVENPEEIASLKRQIAREIDSKESPNPSNSTIRESKKESGMRKKSRY